MDFSLLFHSDFPNCAQTHTHATACLIVRTKRILFSSYSSHEANVWQTDDEKPNWVDGGATCDEKKKKKRSKRKLNTPFRWRRNNIVILIWYVRRGNRMQYTHAWWSDRFSFVQLVNGRHDVLCETEENERNDDWLLAERYTSPEHFHSLCS